MDTNDIFQWLETDESFQPQADPFECAPADDYQMEAIQEHCAESLPSQVWNFSYNFTTMTHPTYAMTSDEGVEHDYQVELNQEYYNESLPGLDWDLGMSYTTKTPTAAASVQEDEAAVDQKTSTPKDEEDLIDLKSADLKNVDCRNVDHSDHTKSVEHGNDHERVELVDLKSVDQSVCGESAGHRKDYESINYSDLKGLIIV